MNGYFPLKWTELLSLAGLVSLLFTILKEFGLKPSYSASIAILAYFVVVTMCSISRVWSRKGDRFRLVTSKTGEAAYNEIQSASQAIRVTHFNTRIPSQTYVSMMVEKLDQGIQISRLVGHIPGQDPETYRWLEQFQGHKNYSEYHLDECILPLDFIIFDDRTVILNLPTHTDSKEFHQAMIFNNQQVALIFRGIFERLILQSRRGVLRQAPDSNISVQIELQP